MTKSWARDAAGMRADIDRFRKELNTDYIDVFMMHCLTEDGWTQKYTGAMDVLSEAQAEGRRPHPRLLLPLDWSVARRDALALG